MARLPAVAVVVAFAATLAPAGQRPGPARPGGAAPTAGPVAGALDEALDEALGGERSLLSFLPDAPRSGRYVVDAPARVPGAAARHRGVFWRTPGGNVYTLTVPYDRDLVLRETRPTADRLRGRTPPSADPSRRPPMQIPMATQPVDVGDEFQYSLERLVAMIGLPPAVVPWETPECRAAFAAYETAARRAVRAVEPRFVRTGATETWRIGLIDLRAGLRPLHEAVRRACDGDSEEYPDPAVVLVERSARRLSVRLGEIPQGYGHYPEEHVVRVTPGPVGPPPLAPRPVPAFDLLHDYLLAVNACGGRPWEYSNFAAGDMYNPPADLTVGPTMFSEEWLCAEDVPPDRRDG